MDQAGFHDAAPLVLRHDDHGDLASLHPWLDEQAAAWHLPEAMLHGMRVALEEAVMNAAMHGFTPGTSGLIVVRARRDTGMVMLIVEDRGRAFDPTTAGIHPRPETLHDLEPGGLGLTLLRHYCKDMHHERTGGLNLLTLRFPLPTVMS